MQEFNRNTVEEVSEAAAKALQAVATQYGLVINYKGTNFTKANATMKFEFATVNANGTVVNRESEAFTLLASRFGLDPSDLGREFSCNGYKFIITGLNTKALAQTSPAYQEAVKKLEV